MTTDADGDRTPPEVATDEQEQGGRHDPEGSYWEPEAGITVSSSPTGPVWDASGELPRESPVASTQRLPDDQLRRWSLVGIGIVVLLTIFVTILGLAAKWVSEEFARLMLQLVVPPLLSAFAVVVGYLFAERKRS